MKRITDYVGIGDINPEASLHIAPLHADDVALKIQGTQNGTQTGNLMEIVDSSGTTVRVMNKNGVEARTGATSLTGSDAITDMSNGTGTGTVTVYRKVFHTVSYTNTVATADVITIPTCGAVAIHGVVEARCVCGAEIGSAGCYRLEGLVTSHATSNPSGTIIGSLVTPVACSNAVWAPAIGKGADGANTAVITVVGSANAGVKYSWFMDLTYTILPAIA